MINRVTDVVATGAVLTPFWYDSLKLVSENAALLLPIFGLTWLIIQMVDHFRKD